MKNKKIKLIDLTVKSFVTDDVIHSEAAQQLKGGSLQVSCGDCSNFDLPSTELLTNLRKSYNVLCNA